MSQSERVSRHSDVSSALASRSDRRLAAMLKQAQTVGSGIGGDSVLCEVAGVPVFAKRIPLTDGPRRLAGAGGQRHRDHLGSRWAQ